MAARPFKIQYSGGRVDIVTSAASYEGAIRAAVVRISMGLAGKANIYDCRYVDGLHHASITIVRGDTGIRIIWNDEFVKYVRDKMFGR